MKEIKTRRDLMKVLADGHTVEYKSIVGEEWFTVENFGFNITTLDDTLLHVYRIKTTKPSIDWSQVSDKYKYLARDEDGQVYLYVNKHVLKQNNWWTLEDGDYDIASVFKSLDVGNCIWSESLVERPEGI